MNFLISRAYSFSFVASATAQASQISAPGTSNPGDVGVMFDLAATASAPITKVVPTNWTELSGTISDGAIRVVVSMKLLSAADIASPIVGMNSDLECKTLFVFRPTGRPYFLGSSVWNAEVTNGNPALQTVLASGVQVPLIVLGMASSPASNTDFSTATPAFDATVLNTTGVGLSSRAGYKIYNSSPANHSIDMNDLGSSNALTSGYIRFQ